MVHLDETIFPDGELQTASDTQTPCDAMRGTAIGIPMPNSPTKLFLRHYASQNSVTDTSDPNRR